MLRGSELRSWTALRTNGTLCSEGSQIKYNVIKGIIECGENVFVDPKRVTFPEKILSLMVLSEDTSVLEEALSNLLSTNQ